MCRKRRRNQTGFDFCVMRRTSTRVDVRYVNGPLDRHVYRSPPRPKNVGAQVIAPPGKLKETKCPLPPMKCFAVHPGRGENLCVTAVNVWCDFNFNYSSAFSFYSVPWLVRSFYYRSLTWPVCPVRRCGISDQLRAASESSSSGEATQRIRVDVQYTLHNIRIVSSSTALHCIPCT